MMVCCFPWNRLSRRMKVCSSQQTIVFVVSFRHSLVFYHNEFPQVDMKPETGDVHSEYVWLREPNGRVSIPPLVPEMPSQPLPFPTTIPSQPSMLPVVSACRF